MSTYEDIVISNAYTSPKGNLISLGGGGITADGQATLTNKDLVDNSVSFIDDGDATKKVAFELSGLSTSTTRTLTVPDKNGTIALTDDVLTDYFDNVFTISHVNDATQKMQFSAEDITSSTTRTFHFPDLDDNVVTRNSTDILTNKTLDLPTVRIQLRINNPLNTFSYKISPAPITGNRSINMPILTLDDEWAFLNHPSEFTNKNFATSVSIADTPAKSPVSSAVLQLNSSSKALALTSHSTAEQNAIVSPIASLITYNNSTARFNGYSNSGWEPLHRPRYGAYYVSTPAITDILTPGVNVFTKVGGTTTSNLLSLDVTMPVDNRLTYGGTKSRVFKIEATLTATSATGNKTYEFGIYKNGTTLISGSCQTVYLSTNKDNNTSLLVCDTANKNDYYEIWCRNITDTTNVTVDKLSAMINSID